MSIPRYCAPDADLVVANGSSCRLRSPRARGAPFRSRGHARALETIRGDSVTTQVGPIARASVPALDAILGNKLPVLDSGFIRVIDYMGDDSSIVQAARVSYGAGTKTVSEDRALI